MFFHKTIPRVSRGVIFVMIAHWWRRLVVGSSPSLHLILSVHLDGFFFVFADKLTITALVQSPVLLEKMKKETISETA